MHVSPSNPHAAAAHQPRGGSAPHPTAATTPPGPTPGAGNTANIGARGAPLTTGATAVNAQVLASIGGPAGPAPGNSGNTPAAIARQFAAAEEYEDMPFGKIVSQVARGELSLADLVPAEEATADVTVDAAAEIAPSEESPEAAPATEITTEGTTQAPNATGTSEVLADIVTETVAAQNAEASAELIEAFEEGAGVNIEV